MKLILKNGMSVLYKNGMSLTGMNIDSIVAESKEDRAELRMLLTSALKVDERGCHALGQDFGSNALSQSSDVSNGCRALGNKESKGAGLKFNYPLEDTLQIIDTLAAVLNINGCSDVKDTASEKLNLLIQSI